MAKPSQDMGAEFRAATLWISYSPAREVANEWK
jgi:hypothetical protein